jgi:hypothetical protein
MLFTLPVTEMSLHGGQNHEEGKKFQLDLIGLLRKGSLIHKVLTRTNLQLKRVSPHVLCLVSVQGSLSMACNYHFSCETARGAARGAAAVLHAAWRRPACTIPIMMH